MPERDVRGVWISVDMAGIGGIAAYRQVMMTGVEYQATLAMVHLAPAAVPPEQ